MSENRIEQTTAAKGKPFVVSPVVAGILSVLTIAAGAVASVAVATPGVLPVGVVVAAIITGSVAGAGAFYSGGGTVPLDLLTRALQNINSAATKGKTP